MKRLTRTTARTFAYLVLPALTGAIVACSGTDDGDLAAGGDSVHADEVEIVRGVPDKGRTPAVVAVDIGGVGLCTGTLIAPGVVLTARHCVSETAEEVDCPSAKKQITGERAADSLHILAGDDVTTAQVIAVGREVVTPRSNVLCDEDIALIVLDREVKGITPLAVSTTGVATGGHVRAVGYGRRGDGQAAGVKLLRDHVNVIDTSPSEFVVGEGTCQGDSGGPALDEQSGEVVGVVSRGGPACDGKDTRNIYTRTDAFLQLIDQAIAASASTPPPGSIKADAGLPKSGGKASKPDPDLGSACQGGSDCAAGVCVSEHQKQYCSRHCDSHDHCPTHFRCTAVSGGTSVCIEH